MELRLRGDSVFLTYGNFGGAYAIRYETGFRFFPSEIEYDRFVRSSELVLDLDNVSSPDRVESKINESEEPVENDEVAQNLSETKEMIQNVINKYEVALDEFKHLLVLLDQLTV